jgi:hypothetical protein
MAAARKTALRAVGADEKPAAKKTLVEAAECGDYRELLVAQRMDIARSLQNPETQGPARAALHRQLGLIAREIRELDEAATEEAAENGPTADEAFDASAV